MKVKELIKTLEEMNPETEVLISKDSEGNSYRSLTAMSSCFGDKDRWEWEVYDDCSEGLVPVIIFYP